VPIRPGSSAHARGVGGLLEMGEHDGRLVTLPWRSGSPVSSDSGPRLGPRGRVWMLPLVRRNTRMELRIGPPAKLGGPHATESNVSIWATNLRHGLRSQAPRRAKRSSSIATSPSEADGCGSAPLRCHRRPTLRSLLAVRGLTQGKLRPRATAHPRRRAVPVIVGSVTAPPLPLGPLLRGITAKPTST